MSEYIRNIRAKIGTDLLLVVGAAAVVVNDAGEILLQRRSDNGRWGLPGGSIDPGEEPADTVVREVWEETGIEVVPERVVSVTGGPDHLASYPNGDQIAIVSITFLCRPVGGVPHINDDESLEVRYFAPDALPDLEPRHLLRIQATLRNDLRAYFRVNNFHNSNTNNKE
jgi:8-oxo-dGTP diphosphatase